MVNKILPKKQIPSTILIRSIFLVSLLLVASEGWSQGFVQPTNNPLAGVQVPLLSVPAFGDLDNDGDLDLLVGAADSYVIYYYRNTGSATAPVFTQGGNLFSPNPTPDGAGFAASIGDIDGDGKLDVAVGNGDGTVLFYKNTGTASSPAFTQQTGLANPFSGIDIGSYSAPDLSDLDGDGDLDLVVGSLLRDDFGYFENTGSKTAPKYVQRTGSANPLNGVTGAPSIGDVDKDGDLDVVTGTNSELRLFLNTGTPTTPVLIDRSDLLANIAVSDNTYPGLGDLDGDGDLDLALGTFGPPGTLAYWQNVIQITRQPAPASQTVCVGGSVSTTIQARSGDAITYQWYRNARNTTTPVAGQTTATLQLANVQLNDAGVYYARVTGGGGAIYSNAFILTVEGVAIAQQPVSGSSVCPGTTVTAFVSTSGTAMGYQWYRNGAIVGGQTAATLTLSNTSPAQNGSYVVVVTSSCNSVTSTAFSLTVYALPTAYAVTGGGSYCAGGTGVALGLADSQTGVTYQLFRATTPVGSALAGTGNALSFGLQSTPGSYSVLATNATTNCQQAMTGTVSVTRTALPTATLRNDGPITCAKPTVILTAGGGTSYSFSGGIAASGNSATVTQGGTYTVTVTANGCSSLTTTTVLSNTLVPTASITPSSTTLTCASPSVSLTAVGTGSVRWDDNSTSAIRVVSSSGTYSVTLTGGNGCSAVASAVVSQDNAAPLASLVSSGSLSCGVTSVTLTATPNGLSYVFSNGASQIGTTNQAVVNASGLYSVTVLSANGCSSVASTSVSQDNTAPSATLASSGPLSCAVTSVTLTASPSGLSYVFSGGATPIGTSNQAVVNASGTYSVTVVSVNGCSSVASTSVNQDSSAPSATLASSGPLSCAVTSVTLTASPSGLSYVFSGPSVVSQNGNTAVANAAGTYSVTVVSANGCSAAASTSVASSTALVSVTIPTVTTATQGLAFSQAFTASGGVTGSPDRPYRYSLVSGSLPSGLSLATTGGLAGTPTQAGSFTLTVGATDANGCSGVSPVYVLRVSEPIYVGSLRLIAPLYNCQTGAITFRTVGGNGSTIEYRAIGVTDWTTNPSQIVDLPVRQDANAQPLPLQARQDGVEVQYTFDFRFYCNSTTPNQPPVFTQPPTQTAIVGQPFTYRIPDETFRDLNGTAINFMVMNLPAGLTYSSDTRIISGVPTAVGSYSVTLSVSDPLSQSASGTLVIVVNPVAQPPVSTTVNVAPVFNGPLAAQSGTVSQAFAYQLPVGVFTDPNAGDVLTYQALSLPAGLSFTASNQTLSGTPTTAGTYSVTLTATDQGGLSASGLLTVVISTSAAPPTGNQPLAVIQPLYDCTTGAITFRTTGGDGSPIYFTSVGIVGYSTQTSYVLEAAIRNDANSQPLLIKATQNGVTTSYLFDFRLYCNGTVVTTPPVFTGPLPTQMGQVEVRFSYALPANSFTALNGGTLNYAVTGLPAGLSFTAGANVISGVPTQAGSVTATLTATDPLNQSGQGPLVFVIAPASQPPVGVQPLTLLAPLYDCGTGAFTFRSSGGDGSSIEYFAVGITGFTSVAGPYTVLPAGDAQPFTLKARQSGVEVIYTWDFKAVCLGSGRVGVAEVAESWTLRSVGNPITGELVVEVVGAAGQSLQLQLTDLSGHVVETRLIQPVSALHREVFEVSRQGAGVLVLQAQSVLRRQTLKVLKL